jgi:predicted nucleotide-binding protein
VRSLLHVGRHEQEYDVAPRRKKPTEPLAGTDILPTVSPSRGIELLNRTLEKGRELLSEGFESDDHSQWETTTRGFLVRIFGSLSPNVRSVLDVGKYGSFPGNADPEWWDRHRTDSLRKQLRILEGLIEVLEVDIGAPDSQLEYTPPVIVGRKVFLVHGHDLGALHNTARFLERLALDPVVLHEQPDSGRTIIEKFVDYSDVGFAVVLLTPDDRGGVVSASADEYSFRARQNVILELGYFLGKLGRNRVCALYSEGVEIPSDYSGVLFVPFDESGGWRLKLARELKAAGFEVDMNRAV